MESITNQDTDNTLDKKEARKEMFSDLFGKWTAEEKAAFDKTIEDLQSIDKSEWK